MASSLTSSVDPMSATMYPEASGKSNPCKRDRKTELVGDRVRRQAVEVFVPFGEPAVEDGRVGDQHRLVVVGRGEHGLAAESKDDLGLVAAEDLARATRASNESNSRRLGMLRLIRIATPRISAGLRGLGQPDVRTRRVRRRLAVGQVDDTDRVALASQPGQRTPAGNLDIVGVGPDGDQVELRSPATRPCAFLPRDLAAVSHR